MIYPFRAIPILLVLYVASVNADEENTLDSTMKSLASDLSELNVLFDSNQVNMGDVYENISNPMEVFKLPEGTKGSLVELQGGKIEVTGKRSSNNGTSWYAVQGSDPNISFQGWVPADQLVESLGGPPNRPSSRTVSNYLEEKIMEKIRTIKEKYDNNPYLYVDGFSLTAGVPPSATVTFSFRGGAATDGGE